jgi:hypothetical protein
MEFSENDEFVNNNLKLANQKSQKKKALYDDDEEDDDSNGEYVAPLGKNEKKKLAQPERLRTELKEENEEYNSFKPISTQPYLSR